MQQEMEDMEAEARAQTKSEVLSIFSKANRPVTLKFDNVVYKAKAQNGGFLPKNSISGEKIILKGVTGVVSPGEILAMLGPSGSGKTTLLTALGGRLSGQLSGRITYNDKPFSNVMKRNTGFVLQDDVLYPHLTVTETLVFTALLRLPNSLTKEEKISHAESVIAQLGLTRCQSSIIGGPLIRGVSGGERKRVSIGQEMLMNPSLLLLDEPTSGLDSTTAQRIVSTLRELSNGGRTVVMTIHQPSSRIFYLFNKVLLLSEGNPVYFGNASEAMDYFSRIGYTPSVAMNPSDFMLDLANGVSSDDSKEDHNVVKQTLISAFKSNIEENLKAQVRETCTHHYDVLEEKKSAKWATTWWEQFMVLLRRGVKEWKHETFNGLKVGQVLVVAFLSGLLWWKSSVAHLQDQIGLLFFYSGFWGFFPLFHGLFVFPQDRMILQKERSSGMYKLSAYFMARIVGGLPMELVLPTIFVTITYWMAGLKPTALHFSHTLFVLLYNVLVTQGLGLALGAAFMDQKSATVLGSVTMLTFQLAGGYFIQHVPPFIAWIKYVSVSQHVYKLLLGSQYTANEAYPCPESLGGITSTCFVGDFPSVKQVGLDGQALSVVALGIMLIGYRLIAYVSLIRIGVTTK